MIFKALPIVYYLRSADGGTGAIDVRRQDRRDFVPLPVIPFPIKIDFYPTQTTGGVFMAAEIWITVFQMQHKRKIRAFLKCVDEHDDGYHPISYQIERGVRYL